MEETNFEEKFLGIRSYLDKMKYKKLSLFASLLFILLASGCTQSSWNSDSYSQKSIEIQELSKDPNNYGKKVITIRGQLSQRIGGFSLKDNEGYWVWLEDNCIEKQRDYRFLSQIYEAKGVWTPPREKNSEYDFVYGMESYYRLNCSSPLS